MKDWIAENSGLTIFLFIAIIFAIMGFINHYINKQAALNRQVHDLLEVITKEFTNLRRRNDYVFKALNNRLTELEETGFSVQAVAPSSSNANSTALEIRINMLEQTLNQFTRQNSNIILPKETASLSVPQPSETIVRKRIFMPLPDRNKNGFRKLQGKDTPAGTSVYVLEIDPAKPALAAFNLMETQQVEELAINFSDSYLQACATKGTFALNKKIKRIKPGIVELQGDYWLITEKAQIEYV